MVTRLQVGLFVVLIVSMTAKAQAQISPPSLGSILRLKTAPNASTDYGISNVSGDIQAVTPFTASGVVLKAGTPTAGRNYIVAQTGTSGTDSAFVVYNSNIMDVFRVRGDGKVGINTSTPTEVLDVNGNINVTGTINAKYQDVAEWVSSGEELPPGTVVTLDRHHTNQVAPSTHAYDTAVAGVVSAQPGIILGEGATTKSKVATTGRVRVKVDATEAIAIGDLLVTSDRAGMAMKSRSINVGSIEMHRPGTIIGKALEPLEAGTGEILVLLSLQ